MEGPSSQTKRTSSVYWDFLGSKHVYTTDRRMVGFVRGIVIDPVGPIVSHLVVEVHDDILRELDLPAPPLETVLVDIPTSQVKAISDIVQLTADLAVMKGFVKVHAPGSVRGGLTALPLAKQG